MGHSSSDTNSGSETFGIGAAAVEGLRPPRVFISYAWDSDAHREAVRKMWLFLRAHGVDAQIDLVAAEQRQDWAQWMERQVAEADHILVIASPAYKQRASYEADPSQGRGVQYEARLIRNLLYGHQADLQRFLPVVLPGGNFDDLPEFLTPSITTVFYVSAFTVAGAEPLLRLLHKRPREIEPAPGPVPDLSARDHILGGTDSVEVALAQEAGPMATVRESLAGVQIDSESIDPLRLEVHRAISTVSPPEALPLYVRRAHDADVDATVVPRSF